MCDLGQLIWSPRASVFLICGVEYWACWNGGWCEWIDIYDAETKVPSWTTFYDPVSVDVSETLCDVHNYRTINYRNWLWQHCRRACLWKIIFLAILRCGILCWLTECFRSLLNAVVNRIASTCRVGNPLKTIQLVLFSTLLLFLIMMTHPRQIKTF